MADGRFYERIDHDPIKENQRTVKSTINAMINANELPSTAKNLIVPTPKTSRFYLLPKIHKAGNPGRPIVSACNCPTENIASYLDGIMSPLVRDLETYVKDTNHALNIINDFRFDDTMTGERFLYTMDIKSLYTVIPNNSGLEALAHFLDKRTVLEPPTSTLTRLAELVLTLNAFTFNGDFYKQTGGVAMGSKMGPNYACLFVGYIEEQIARQYTGFVPQLHKRYIDDVLGVACCSRLELDNYINFVSNFHPALQFTHTISASDISFLDINLRITNDRISTSIHYKVTDTHSYLHKQSSHPRHCKDGLPRSQLLRLRRLCSDDSDFLEKGKEMISFFVQRGYCASSLQRDLDAIQRVNRNNVIKQQDSESRNRSRIPLVLTFHPLSERIKRILVSNFNILSGDPQTKEIFPQPPLVAYRRDCNVRDALVHTADRNQPGPHVGTSPCTHNRCRTCDYISRDSTLQGPQCSFNIKDAFTCKSSGLVYAISCRRCSAVYIGETGRTLRERFGEHLRSIEKNLPGFPVAEHFNANGHTLQDAQVRGVMLCGGNKLRKRQEMRLIFKLGTSQPHGLNSDFRYL